MTEHHDNSSEHEIGILISLSEDELFIRIGQSLFSKTIGLEEPTKEDELAEGQGWMGENIERLRFLFCSNELLTKAMTTTDKPDYQLLIILSDTIAQHFTIVPPLTVAVLLIKIGKTRLCGNHK